MKQRTCGGLVKIKTAGEPDRAFNGSIVLSPDSIQDIVADPNKWLFTKDGLTIDLGQLGAYAEGKPRMRFAVDGFGFLSA